MQRQLEFATSFYSQQVRFQVPAAASMKMTAFWDITWARSRLLIALMMEAVRTSETSVNFYETTRSNIPGDCHLVLNKIAKQTKLCKLREGNEIPTVIVKTSHHAPAYTYQY
jgi:hypothetical protein